MTSAVALLLSVLSVQAQEAKPALHLEATIALPKVEGRIDHLALDRHRDRLFVAALGNGTLEVLDSAARRHLKSIAGLKEPQGVVCLEEDGKVCVADGELGTLEVYDAVALEKTRSMKVGADADNVRFDPRSKLLYVGVESGALAIVDTKTWKVVGKILFITWRLVSM